MQTYSLVFLDIDGTLLDSNHQIMPQTKQILNRLEKRGIPIILCSARSPGGVETVERQAGLHSPIVCYGGSLILTADREILSDTGMSLETAVSFKRFVLDRFVDVVVSAYIYDVWLVDNASHPAIQREAGISQCVPLAGDLRKAAQMSPHVHKLLCIGTQQQILAIQNSAAREFPELTLARSGPIYLEVMPKDISKRTAAKRLGEYFSVTRESMVAFGDNFVDLELLRYAGLGVAMGNAPQEVRQAMGRITASNDEEGIYIALRHLRFSAPKQTV